MQKVPIVVLTPVKNEDWILERFLKITSKFADKIILADQQSTDNTLTIASSFPKVLVIRNENPEYDESFRQELLIRTAREQIPGQKILLALDADELLCADSLHSREWQAILEAKPGTQLYFEKPDILFPLTKCRRYNDYFLLGFVDDDTTEHIGKKIHSPRVPGNLHSPKLFLETIKFMHYGKTRILEYKARQRYYSVTENINKITSTRQRLQAYGSFVFENELKQHANQSPESWFKAWEEEGIPVRSITMSEKNMFNLKVLEILMTIGSRPFFYDDIWNFNWNSFKSEIYPNTKDIRYPGFVHRVLLKLFISLLKMKNS